VHMKPHRFESHNRGSLVDQERSAEQPAEDIIARAEIGSGGIIADLGCGNGYLSVPLSRRAGFVLALDVSPEMLGDLMGRCDEDCKRKVLPIRCELPELPLRSSSLDHLFMVNVLHEFEDQSRMVAEAFRVLKDGGRVTLVDFQKRPTTRGPPMEMRIDEADVPSLFNCMRLLVRHSFPSYYQFEFAKTL
jgi:ubiquinone/menaquinone biosynthesis C-methylase UbiE